VKICWSLNAITWLQCGNIVTKVVAPFVGREVHDVRWIVVHAVVTRVSRALLVGAVFSF
jgi:hypothetical protein